MWELCTAIAEEEIAAMVKAWNGRTKEA